MTTVAAKPAAVETAPLAYLKDFESTEYCMSTCCVHLDTWSAEPHAQFECAHGIWRFAERIHLTRAINDDHLPFSDRVPTWSFNIDGGDTRYVQLGSAVWGTLVCGDCGSETAIEGIDYQDFTCTGCGAVWARTTEWTYEAVPADEVSNPLNVLDYRAFRPALEELRDQGDLNFAFVFESELDSAEAKSIGRHFKAVVTEEVIAQFEEFDTTDKALAHWKQLVAEAETNGTIGAALEQLAEREAADAAERKAEARRAEQARNAWYLASLTAPARTPYVGPKPAVPSRVMSVADFESRGIARKGYVAVIPTLTTTVRDTAFGRIVEGGAR